jgi:16S rRNA processing protein RimM
VILVRAGRLLKAQGVRGWVKCEYTTDNPAFLGKRPAYLLIDPRTNECFPVNPEAVELHSDYFRIRFQQFTAPEPLRRFSGWDLAFPARRGELPRDTDEVYYFELLGMEVVDVSHSGAHVVLELDTDPPRLIPFIREFVPEVSLAEGWMVSTYPLDAEEGPA